MSGRAKHVQRVRELWDAIGAHDLLATQVEAQINSLNSVLGADAPEEERAAVRELGRRMRAEQSVLLERVLHTWLLFTEEELAELTRFFLSPIGRRYVAELPGLTEAQIRIGSEWGAEIGRSIESDG